jgi:hypothetical protein
LSSSDIFRLLRRLSAERLRLRDLSSSEAIVSLYDRARCTFLACLGPGAKVAVPLARRYNCYSSSVCNLDEAAAA